MHFSEGVSKKDEKAMIKQRLAEALVTGQKICIDCSLEEHMSEKVGIEYVMYVRGAEPQLSFDIAWTI